MNLVIDASVAVKFYLPEVFEVGAAKLLNGEYQFHVPDLIYPEFSNVIWKKARRVEIDIDEGIEIVSAFSKLNVVTHSARELALSAYTGASETGQTVYDWTYLALAISLKCEFVTADEQFYKAIEPTAFKQNILWIGNV